MIKYNDNELASAYKNVSTVTKQDNKLCLTWENNDENFKRFMIEFIKCLEEDRNSNYNEHIHVRLYEIKDKAGDIIDDPSDSEFVAYEAERIKDIANDLIEVVENGDHQ